jgi:hypothetical protein
MSLLPADSPRMPKWPFLAGDALLLGLALVIGCYAHNPFAGKTFILIAACVALGAVLGTWPFIADYESKRNETLDERQRGLEALAHTITSSAEQISIAAQSLPGIAETAAKSLKLAEQLPARLQEKMGEIKSRLAEVPVAKKESSTAEPTADHIRQAVAELAKFEAAAQKNLAAAGDKLEAKATQIFKQLDTKIAALSALADKFSARPEPVEGLVEGAEPIVIEPPTEETKTPRKRAPKKSKGEDAEPSLDFDASAKSVDSSPAPSASTAGDEFSSPSPHEPARPEPAERVESAPVAAVSADGATRLLVTAYIGIGNKLFVRGDGPGLSWDEGVPLQFVSIGKWRWETADATVPVHAKLYKNDEIVCASLGKLTIDPGQQAEVTAAF